MYVDWKIKLKQAFRSERSLPHVGTPAEIDLFMAGKQSLPGEKFERLCNLLWIKFRI
jgi:hypothetical protein